MRGDLIPSHILSIKLISNVTQDMVKQLNLPQGHYSIGMFTADCDDVTYTGMDEATKKANVKVVYGMSAYAGFPNAYTKLGGEVIGMISGPTPAEVKSGLQVICDVVENGAHFISVNDDDSIIYFAHCINRTGSYLSELAGIPEGDPLCYMTAPPTEAMYGLDAALKAADVRMVSFFEPPSRTNFGGGFLTGTQAACRAACDAFGDAVRYVADHPLKF